MDPQLYMTSVSKDRTPGGRGWPSAPFIRVHRLKSGLRSLDPLNKGQNWLQKRKKDACLIKLSSFSSWFHSKYGVLLNTVLVVLWYEPVWFHHEHNSFNVCWSFLFYSKFSPYCVKWDKTWISWAQDIQVQMVWHTFDLCCCYWWSLHPSVGGAGWCRLHHRPRQMGQNGFQTDWLVSEKTSVYYGLKRRHWNITQVHEKY